MDTTGSASQDTPLNELEREVLTAVHNNAKQWSTYRYDQLARDLNRAGDPALDSAAQQLAARGLLAFHTPLQDDSELQLTADGEALAVYGVFGMLAAGPLKECSISRALCDRFP